MQLPQFGHCERANIKLAQLMEHLNAHMGTHSYILKAELLEKETHRN